MKSRFFLRNQTMKLPNLFVTAVNFNLILSFGRALGILMRARITTPTERTQRTSTTVTIPIKFLKTLFIPAIPAENKPCTKIKILNHLFQNTQINFSAAFISSYLIN
jgi:hypothetical protein